MSRIMRIPQKRFVVFCEGDTEFNYFNSMKLKAGVEFTIKPINMRGGGYSSFLKKIKTDPPSNCLAKFIIIDGDRILDGSGEKKGFEELLEYCKHQNKNGKIPHFLIVNNPRFEFVACLHFPDYRNQDIDNFLTHMLNLNSIDQFKSRKDVYNILNTGDKSFSNIIERSNFLPWIVCNKYRVKKKEYKIESCSTLYNEDNIGHKCTNIAEFYNIIDW